MMHQQSSFLPTSTRPGIWCVKWRERFGLLAMRFDLGCRPPTGQPRPQREQQQASIQSQRGVDNIRGMTRNRSGILLKLQRVKDYETQTISHSSAINKHLACSEINFVARTTQRPPPKPSKPISTTPSAPHDAKRVFP